MRSLREIKDTDDVLPLKDGNYSFEFCLLHATHAWKSLKATFHLTIYMRRQRATGKIQRNNYHDGSCGPSLIDKTSSVSLIFTQGTHRNVKNC